MTSISLTSSKTRVKLGESALWVGRGATVRSVPSATASAPPSLIVRVNECRSRPPAVRAAPRPSPGPTAGQRPRGSFRAGGAQRRRPGRFCCGSRLPGVSGSGEDSGARRPRHRHHDRGRHRRRRRHRRSAPSCPGPGSAAAAGHAPRPCWGPRWVPGVWEKPCPRLGPLFLSVNSSGHPRPEPQRPVQPGGGMRNGEWGVWSGEWGRGCAAIPPGLA